MVVIDRQEGIVTAPMRIFLSVEVGYLFKTFLSYYKTEYSFQYINHVCQIFFKISQFHCTSNTVLLKCRLHIIVSHSYIWPKCEHNFRIGNQWSNRRRPKLCLLRNSYQIFRKSYTFAWTSPTKSSSCALQPQAVLTRIWMVLSPHLRIKFFTRWFHQF